MNDLVFHLLFFGTLVCVLLALPMVFGRLVRPKLPTPEKDAIYECGEPAIGSSYIQFDLRFYVVALLFIVFDVEVAFFFPWAAIYGSAMHLADTRLTEGARVELSGRLLDLDPQVVQATGNVISPEIAQKLAFTGFFDLLVFFVVLLVGFAYVWKRGDLDWVRALTQKSRQATDQTLPSSGRSSSVTTSA